MGNASSRRLCDECFVTAAERRQGRSHVTLPIMLQAYFMRLKSLGGHPGILLDEFMFAVEFFHNNPTFRTNNINPAIVIFTKALRALRGSETSQVACNILMHVCKLATEKYDEAADSVVRRLWDNVSTFPLYVEWEELIGCVKAECNAQNNVLRVGGVAIATAHKISLDGCMIDQIPSAVIVDAINYYGILDLNIQELSLSF